MTRKRKPVTRPRIPPHKRIPGDRGLLTRTTRTLYDLIYFSGLGGCWMSNQTISRKLQCCTRTVQRARSKLVKCQIIITARTNPHTWIMWSRYHMAVKNCQVLLYPHRQKMDNPWYVLAPDSSGVTKTGLRGDKMSPKSDVVSSSYLLTGRDKKEPAISTPVACGPPSKKQAEPTSSQGSAPNPATPSGLTGNLSAETAYDEIPFQLMPGEEFLYKSYVDNFVQMGYPAERAAKVAFPIVKVKLYSPPGSVMMFDCNTTPNATRLAS